MPASASRPEERNDVYLTAPVALKHDVANGDTTAPSGHQKGTLQTKEAGASSRRMFPSQGRPTLPRRRRPAPQAEGTVRSRYLALGWCRYRAKPHRLRPGAVSAARHVRPEAQLQLPSAWNHGHVGLLERWDAHDPGAEGDGPRRHRDRCGGRLGDGRRDDPGPVAPAGRSWMDLEERKPKT